MNITKNLSKSNNDYIIPKNTNNLTSIILYHNNKNKSRNKNSDLLFFTESNLKEKSNNIKTFFNTSNNIGRKANLSSLYSKNYCPKPNYIKIKKLYKKQLKELLNNLDHSKTKDIFGNKKNIFKKISYKTEKIPKVKTQEQLNYYLINDFKENVPPKIEISKSIKNRKMDDDFEIYKTLLKEKKYKKNEYLIKEYRRKNEIKSSLNKDSEMEFKRKSKKKLTGYRPVLLYNDKYQNHFKIKEKENDNIFNESNKTQIHYNKSSKNKIFFNTPSKKSKEILHFNSPKKRKSEIQKINFDNINPYAPNYSFNNINNIHSVRLGKTNRTPNKSEELYKEQKKNYNKYLRKIKILRAKNYIDQIKKLEMEENKLKERNEKNEWIGDKKIKLTELDEDRFLLEIKKKNIFLDSFGIAGKNINSKDDDIDEDNFKGIKNYHINLGMGATYINNLKMKIEPRYILKHFKKKTIDKYKGNKGIYLGPNKKNM